jgi:hypothetical protein
VEVDSTCCTRVGQMRLGLPLQYHAC